MKVQFLTIDEMNHLFFSDNQEDWKRIKEEITTLKKNDWEHLKQFINSLPVNLFDYTAIPVKSKPDYEVVAKDLYDIRANQLEFYKEQKIHEFYY